MKTLRGMRNDRGVVFLELCASLGIFLFLLLFVSNVGLGFREWNLISFAAREGARYGAVTGNEHKAGERAAALIKSNKELDQNKALSDSYTISCWKSSGLMYVTIQWKGRGLHLESTKCFRISN